MIRGVGHTEAINKVKLKQKKSNAKLHHRGIARNKKSRGVDTWNEWFSASTSKGRVGLADFDTVIFDTSRSRMIKHNSVVGEGGDRGKGLCPERRRTVTGRKDARWIYISRREGSLSALLSEKGGMKIC